MKNKSITSLVAVLSLLGLAAVWQIGVARPAAAEEAASANQQTVLVNLKHHTDDLHAAFMALKIATGLAKKGDDVTIFVNLEGVGLADASAPDDLRWGNSDATIAGLYKGFIAAGGNVMVCPHCAKAAGLAPDRLRLGASIANEGEAIELFHAADKVVDY